eukprot:TRINITY_DN2990_c0_g1_i12.p2 TRINITY_DN2990_c0_g1~~TRINITY_DN2990_c0_g1_i12.p2  ORF type:complete len:126 (-),score=19.97 TRINITY_DN2990_c0_g1_i12:120-497(-)
MCIRDRSQLGEGAGGFYVIMFTCGVCEEKHVRSFTKKAYHEGVVLIRCQGCDNNHLIADNLGWFRNEPVNIEDLMKEQGKPYGKITNNEEIQKMLGETLGKSIEKFQQKQQTKEEQDEKQQNKNE